MRSNIGQDRCQETNAERIVPRDSDVMLIRFWRAQTHMATFLASNCVADAAEAARELLAGQIAG